MLREAGFSLSAGQGVRVLGPCPQGFSGHQVLHLIKELSRPDSVLSEVSRTVSARLGF